MLKYSLLILTISVCCACHAQMCPCEFGGKTTDKPLRNEFGINAFNVNEVLINFTSSRPVRMLNYGNGFMYKRHFNKFSARLGFDYLEHRYAYEARKDADYNFNNGKSFGKDFRLGIEKTLFMKKIQAYVAVDLLFSKSRYSGISQGDGVKTGPYTVAYGFNALSWGFSPAFGIKYRPVRRLSLTAETSLSAIYYRTAKSTGYPAESNVAVIANPLQGGE